MAISVESLCIKNNLGVLRNNGAPLRLHKKPPEWWAIRVAARKSFTSSTTLMLKRKVLASVRGTGDASLASMRWYGGCIVVHVDDTWWASGLRKAKVKESHVHWPDADAWLN
jgi:hypothetical protein